MLNRAREWWERLGRSNQWIIGLSSLGVLIALIGFVTWASAPEYQPLFSNLTAQDANAISDKLKEMNVPYKLTPGGSGIEVPAQMHDETQMKIVSLGLPAQQAGKLNGDDVLKATSITDTKDMETLRMRQSLESRVASTIATMTPIASATIHFAPGNDSPFAVSKSDPAASVLVSVKSGQSLSEENVRAIVRLVQMSAEGLAEKNISVVDAGGHVLFDGTRSNGMYTDDTEKTKRAFEMEKQTKFQAVLDQSLGAHTTIVLVNAKLSQGVKKEHKTTYEPGAASSKAKESETMQGAGSLTRNPVAAGAGANAAGSPNTTAGGATTYQGSAADPGGSFVHENSQSTFDNNKVEEETVIPAGRVEKMTVSALVDDKKISVGQAAAVQKLLENAVTAEADVPAAQMVTVSRIPFDHSQEDASLKQGQEAVAADNMRRTLAIAAPLIIMLIAFFLLARSLKRPRHATGSSGQLALAGAGGGMLGALPMGGLGQTMLDADGNPLPGQTVGGVLMSEEESAIGIPINGGGPRTYEVIEENFDADLETILHLARSKPDMVASLIKHWVTEEA